MALQHRPDIETLASAIAHSPIVVARVLTQPCQRVRYRGLAHAETLGGPADVVVGIDRLENNEKVEVHVLEICGHCTDRSNASTIIV